MAVATLVVPVWKIRPWWPLLQPTPGRWAPFVAGVRDLPTNHDTFKPGQSQGNHKGTDPAHWSCVAIRIDFSHYSLLHSRNHDGLPNV